jgi:hypothetical protein
MARTKGTFITEVYASGNGLLLRVSIITAIGGLLFGFRRVPAHPECDGGDP